MMGNSCALTITNNEDNTPSTQWQNSSAKNLSLISANGLPQENTENILFVDYLQSATKFQYSDSINLYQEVFMNNDDFLNRYIDKMDRDQSDLRADIRENERRIKEDINSSESRIYEVLKDLKNELKSDFKEVKNSTRASTYSMIAIAITVVLSVGAMVYASFNLMSKFIQTPSQSITVPSKNTTNHP